MSDGGKKKEKNKDSKSKFFCSNDFIFCSPINSQRGFHCLRKLSLILLILSKSQFRTSNNFLPQTPRVFTKMYQLAERIYLVE